MKYSNALQRFVKFSFVYSKQEYWRTKLCTILVYIQEDLKKQIDFRNLLDLGRTLKVHFVTFISSLCPVSRAIHLL